MKRSNRLVLLVGVFLAVVAFVGILIIANGSPQQQAPAAAKTTTPTVFAKADIPLGTRVLTDQLDTRDLENTKRAGDAYTDGSLVVGQVAHSRIAAGAQVTATLMNGGATSGAILNVEVPKGLRAMAVQVDQVSGVGTVIKSGDFVDVVVGLTGGSMPLVYPQDQTRVPDGIYEHTSTKVLIQGLQVIGTLLPPAAASDTGSQPSASPGAAGGTTTLNGQQQIVILAVTAQQTEVIKFAQMDGSVSLVLRSTDDFVDANGSPASPPPDKTTGIILKRIVDVYGVLPPELVPITGAKAP